MPQENTDGRHIKWKVLFGDNMAEKHAIEIPETGEYFMYLRVTLTCPTKDTSGKFYVKLQKWNKGYNMTLPITDAFDHIACTSGESRSLFVGELFDLLAGDHVSVWFVEGYNLIRKSSFGAYLT